MLDHSTVTKMDQKWSENGQKGKKEVLGHFLDFGLWDRLDIADSDRTQRPSTVCKVARSKRIIQKPQKRIFEWSKEPKMRFWAIFLTLVRPIDLILQILIELNVLQHSARLPVHKWSFKNLKNGFLNDLNSQKWGFWPFSWLRPVQWTWYSKFW